MINKNNLIILAATAMGLYVVTKMTRPRTYTSGVGALNMGGLVPSQPLTKQIFNTALPGQTGFGWQYFTDGTAIGPDGSYYEKGQKVWSPT